MNTGSNDQWGAVLTQFLTGFTAGFYGTTGLSLNTDVACPIDLDNTWNSDPIYSFGYNMAGTGPLFRDNYSMIFYQDPIPTDRILRQPDEADMRSAAR